jgi:D-glycero-D-manno-heptose 1,7-bisphosphate phosphatase
MRDRPRHGVFLDRDGTLIRHKPYLSDPREVELLPGVVEGLNALRRAGCTLFLHTNQSGVGRGYFGLEDAIACNEEMLRQLGLGADLFADVCVCPEVPDGEVLYRKPSPRYAREMIKKYSMHTTSACYVGDNTSDLETARNVGCLGVGVDTGGHNLRQLVNQNTLESVFPVFDCFLEAASYVIRNFGLAGD